MAALSGDFELRRQRRETANELVINAVVAVWFLLLLIFQIHLRLAGAAIQPTLPMVITVGVMVAASGMAALYIRADPPYRRWRKYAIVAGHILFFVTMSRFSLAVHEPEFTLGFTIATLASAIVFAGLRYDAGVVIFAGLAGFTSFALVVVPAAASPMRAVSVVLAFLLLGMTTAAVAIVVSTLLRLHGESVASERLERFFPPEVVQQIKIAPAIVLGAVEREVTVLFSDISDFTRKSSQMRPQEVVDLLNVYFPRMVEIVFRHRGTLEKYIGDALLAIWGAPLEDPRSAERALRAAVDMERTAAELKIPIHVGIHSGRVAAGHIGADAYMQYAVIGDTTNVASRICGAASAGEILISESTKRQLEGVSVRLETLPEVHVKGKDEPLHLFRVVRLE